MDRLDFEIKRIGDFYNRNYKSIDPVAYESYKIDQFAEESQF